jgi:3-hydroxyisobutyrate dehydrogenase-like beta-hydroxyacid dehydrogenase
VLAGLRPGSVIAVHSTVHPETCALLLNNLLFTANLGTTATALAFGEALGVAPKELAEVLSRASGNSFTLSSIPAVGGTRGIRDDRRNAWQ